MVRVASEAPDDTYFRLDEPSPRVPTTLPYKPAPLTFERVTVRDVHQDLVGDLQGRPTVGHANLPIVLLGVVHVACFDGGTKTGWERRPLFISQDASGPETGPTGTAVTVERGGRWLKERFLGQLLPQEDNRPMFGPGISELGARMLLSEARRLPGNLIEAI